MKTILFLTLLLVFVPLQKPAPSDAPEVSVLNQKWSQERLTVEQAGSTMVPPAAAMIPQNRNFERTRRGNAPPGERDPNNDTLDGRSAAIERSIQESRSPKPIEGYSYRAKFKNSSKKAIEVLFWEYQFRESTDSQQYLTRRQFLCGVSLKPDKEKELRGFSMSGPSDVVSVTTLSKDPQKGLVENVVINRVEYADGSIWQRKDWKFEEIKLTYQRALQSPWIPDTCKGL